MSFLALVIFPFIMILSILVINQNRKLRKENLVLIKRAPHLIVGEKAPPITLLGQEEILNFTNRNKKTLLLIFSSSCLSCDKNLVFWKRLDNQLSNIVRIIAIVPKGIEKAKNLKVNFPIYVTKNIEQFINKYKLFNSSQTILVDKEGEVIWIKAGELNRDDYLKIKELAQNKI
jgi:thioredoxin-related protein